MSSDESRKLGHDGNNAVTTGAATSRKIAKAPLAIASLPSEDRNAASKPKSPSRRANQSTSTKLIQAPIEVASASPICANEPISAILHTMLTAVPVSAALTGV